MCEECGCQGKVSTLSAENSVAETPPTVAPPRYDVRVRNGQIEIKRMGDH